MRWIILLLWFLLGFLYWTAKNDCCNTNTTDAISEKVVAPITKVPIKKLTPIRFACGDDKVKLESGWEKFRDSILNNLQENQLLQVKGFEFSDEVSDEKGTLALARANSVRKFLQIPENKIRLASGVKGKDCVKEELNNMVSFRLLRNSSKIKETDAGTLIYFGSNSTEKLADEEVEAYLDQIASEVKNSGKRIKLTGHTDNQGDASKNLQLGQARADIIKAYLVAKGISAAQIIANSKGELSPISDNATATGRQQNRRTELKVIN